MRASQGGRQRAPRGLLAVLTAAAFLIFAEAFMIAAILPLLAHVFGTGVEYVALAVSAYLVPYGLTGLVWGRWPITQSSVRPGYARQGVGQDR